MAYSLELSAMRRCLDAAQRSAIAQAAVAALAPAPATAKGAVVGHTALHWVLALEVLAATLMTTAAPEGVFFYRLLKGPVQRDFFLRNYCKPGLTLLLTENICGSAVYLSSYLSKIRGYAEPAAPLTFHVRPVNDSLLGVFALWAGFEVCGGGDGSSAQAGVSTGQLRFGVALWSNVPVELAGASLEVSRAGLALICI